MEQSIVAAAIGAALGAGGVGGLMTAYLKHRLDAKKMDHDRVDAHIARLERRIDHLETEHEECLAQNAAQREEVGRLREALARLERKI